MNRITEQQIVTDLSTQEIGIVLRRVSSEVAEVSFGPPSAPKVRTVVSTQLTAATVEQVLDWRAMHGCDSRETQEWRKANGHPYSRYFEEVKG